MTIPDWLEPQKWMQALWLIIIGTIIFSLSFFYVIATNPQIKFFTYTEAVAVWSSYVCTVMVVAGLRVNFVFALISTAAYTLLFFQNDLFASMALNAYLIPMTIYGWWMWSNGDSRKVTSIFDKLKVTSAIGYAAATLTIYLVTVWLVTLLGGKMAEQDSAILILSIMAQILMAQRKVENWMVWIPVNIFGIYVYSQADLALVTIQFWFFLFNAFYGLYVWNKHRVAGTMLA